jgi:acyl carrier protein
MSVIDQDIKAFVLDFMNEHNPVPGETESEQMSVAYLDIGLLDSMALVELVAALEDAFGVRFEPEDLQSPEFGTVGGLIGVVSRLRNP